MKLFKYYVADILPFLLIISLIILAVRYYKYRKNNNDSIKKEIEIFILYLYLSALFLLTVVPKEWLHFNFTADCLMLPNSSSFYNNPVQSIIYIRAFIIEGLWFRLFYVFILNAIMLLPFGFIFPLVYPKHKNKTVFVGFLISVFIEFIQLFLVDRLTDTFDIFLNTIGVIAGFIIYIIFNRIKERRKAN